MVLLDAGDFSPPSDEVPPFANNSRCISEDGEECQAVFNPAMFAYQLSRLLMNVLVQDEMGKERELPGCESRNWRFEHTPRSQDLPFEDRFLSELKMLEEERYNKAWSLKSEDSVDSSIVPTEPEEKVCEKSRSEDCSDFPLGIKDTPSDCHLSETDSPPQWLTLNEKSVRDDTLQDKAAVRNAKIERIKAATQFRKEKDQSQRPPVEADAESPTKKRRTRSL